MTSKYPVCTEDQESHDSENSHSGTFVERGVWLCIDCAMRERDVLLEALQESADRRHIYGQQWAESINLESSHKGDTIDDCPSPGCVKNRAAK